MCCPRLRQRNRGTLLSYPVEGTSSPLPQLPRTSVANHPVSYLIGNDNTFPGGKSAGVQSWPFII